MNPMSQPAYLVNLFDVVAELRRFVDQKLAQIFATLKVGIQQVDQLTHSQVMLLEDALIDGSQGIHDIGDAGDGDGRIMVIGAFLL